MREDNRWRVIPTSANGQPAFAHYFWDEEENAFRAEGIAVLTLDGNKITDLTVFRESELFERFGLPDRL
jgi:RNA polymerase sigma-70 factor, ECF subfamily